MPDFEIVMTVATGQGQGWRKSVIIENVTQEQSVPMGMASLFDWAQEDTDHPIQKAAIDYWQQVRSGALGNVHLMEIQTELEKWGINFGRQELKAEPPPARVPNERQRQAAARNGNGRHAESPPKFDLKSVLQERLAYLQGRQKEITGEVKTLQGEREENNTEIQQIVTFLTIQTPSKKRKANAAVEQLS